MALARSPPLGPSSGPASPGSVRAHRSSAARANARSGSPAGTQGITAEQLVDYCNFIGLDPRRHDLLWIAEQGLRAPVPPPWRLGVDQETGRAYYHDTETDETQWDHPLDNSWRQIAWAYMRRPPPDPAAELPVWCRPKKTAGVQATGPQLVDSSAQAGVTVADGVTQEPAEVAAVGSCAMPLSVEAWTGADTMDQGTMARVDAAGSLGSWGHRRVDSESCASAASGERWSRARHAAAVGPDVPPDATVSSAGGRPLELAAPQNGGGAPVAPPVRPAAEKRTHAAVEALVREMVSSFQHQLRQHRREVLDVVKRDCQRAAEAEDAATVLDAAVPPHSPLPPLPDRPGERSRQQNCAFCAAVLFVHLFLCCAAVLTVPALLRPAPGSWRDPGTPPPQLW
eukprot:TRINITY_DN13311_c0_g1_i1.p1 TRINITY_DN13311_c0_g1~~TRINITY_DN13311_c0_g1_i1.p1  ORF type:complete len:441 (+),score=159.99 TRINITY_DN13311_c0_g1_i1:130-1323(+)